jgi:hypothetical protein
MAMLDAYRGTMEVRDRRAEVRFEPRQWIRIAILADDPPVPDDALRINHWLPGNLRYAGSGRHLTLVADTQLDGIAHLPASLAEIRLGLSDAIGGGGRPELQSADDTRPASAPGEPARRRLEAELNRLPFGAQCLVRRDSPDGIAAWEIRPRIEGAAVPVLLDHTADGVRLYRALVAKVSPGRRPAVVDQALRLNVQLRLCRLAWCGDELVAEALLHAGLTDACWLGSTAQAVAVASTRAMDVLDVLSQHEEVAASWYTAVFCNQAPGNGPGKSINPLEETR